MTKFAKFLDQYGQTRTFLAEAAGVSRWKVSCISNGHFYPTPHDGRKITAALHRLTGQEIKPADFWP